MKSQLSKQSWEIAAGLLRGSFRQVNLFQLGSYVRKASGRMQIGFWLLLDFVRRALSRGRKPHPAEPGSEENANEPAHPCVHAQVAI